MLLELFYIVVQVCAIIAAISFTALLVSWCYWGVKEMLAL